MVTTQAGRVWQVDGRGRALKATARGLARQAGQALDGAAAHVDDASPEWVQGLVGAVSAALVASEIINSADVAAAWQEGGWRLE